MILVLLGPPGAGKGTQAKPIQLRYGPVHVSTGDLFRAALKDQTDLGRAVKKYLDAGQLVPDEVTSEMVARRLAQPDCARGAMLDGYPRTLGQARALDAMLQKRGAALDAVLYFDVSDETAVERLGGRRSCKGCGAGYHVKFMPPRQAGKCDKCGADLAQRSDDQPATIRERLKVYKAQTRALVDEYERRGLLRRIDSNGGPDEIEAAVRAALDPVSGGTPR